MKSRIILHGLTAILFSLLMGVVLAPVLGVSTLAAAGGSLGGSLLFPKPQGAMMMALDVEIWKPWIVESLFKNNQFLNFAINADEYVLQGKVVHIPNAGAASGVSKNRTSLPATVKKRTDTDITYALDEYTSNPRLITDAEKILSYDKMSSAMGQDMKSISQLVAEWILYEWRCATDAAFQVGTTGDAVAAHAPAATGNRKALKPADLETAAGKFDEWDIPDEGRYCMLDAKMYRQLTSALSVTQYRDFSAAYNAAKGIVGEWAGFKILRRSTVLYGSNAAASVPRVPGYAGAATDMAIGLCWHEDCVERAIGEVKLFQSVNDPTYYGDIYSLLINAGGRKEREDNKGVVGIVQVVA
jgi:hypothetical protein